MGSYTVEPPKPWIETPCLYSAALSRAAGCNIYLKLENLQPSGSFKSRGIGNLMQRAAAAASGDNDVHFYCSSGGNAGLACATTATSLDRRATIVVPLPTSPYMVSKLQDLGAAVVRAGANWAAADAHLRDVLLAGDPAGVYVPPFDHPDIWAGAAPLVEEVARQMGRAGPGGAPVDVDAIVCNVGGGGLLVGIMDGVEKVYGPFPPSDSSPPSQRGSPPPPPLVLAVETRGADSLNASVLAGELVTLPGITSIASSLGAPRVAARAFEWAVRAGAVASSSSSGKQQQQQPRLISAVVSDADAVMGSARFLDDARILVEVACGATVSVAYNGDLRRHLGGEAGLSDDEWARKNVVLVVCGGSHMNLELLLEYKAKFGV